MMDPLIKNVIKTQGKARNYLRNKVDQSSFLACSYGLFSWIAQGNFFWLIYLAEGRLKYRLNALREGIRINRSNGDITHNFRRNIHRIEKGLSYKKQKVIFAETYIAETVSLLKQLKVHEEGCPDTIAWGEAVLDKFFNVSGESSIIADAYDNYIELKPKNEQPDWHPYAEKNRPVSSINYQSLYQLALRRRSIRFYLEREVEFDVIEKAMRIASLSPSACNRQSFRFLFYDDSELVEQISCIPGGISGYKVPSIVVIVGSYRGYFDERDINAPIIDASLAAMSFQFALETLGLSSVCINWPSYPNRDQRVRQIIPLEKDEFIVMLLGVGYPDPEGMIPYSAKKEIDNLLFKNPRKHN